MVGPLSGVTPPIIGRSSLEEQDSESSYVADKKDSHHAECEILNFLWISSRVFRMTTELGIGSIVWECPIRETSCYVLEYQRICSE
jgi:hypothetical protein